MEEFDRITAEQGWDWSSVESVLVDFIAHKGLMTELIAYARERADVENTEQPV